MKLFNAVIIAVVAAKGPTTMPPSHEYDFTDVFEAHNFVTETARELFDQLSVNFETARGKYYFKCTIL